MNISESDIPSLIITLVLLLAEVALIYFCRVQLKKPIDPLKPKMLPYGAIMIFATLGIFVTLAHSISLVTGEQLKPRNKMMNGGMGGGQLR